jgi:hypothetical protein
MNRPGSSDSARAVRLATGRACATHHHGPHSPPGRPEKALIPAVAVRGCGFSWSLEPSLVHGSVGAADAVPGADMHSEVGEDPHRDGLGHPRRRSDRGAAGEKRHRPLSPVPVQRQQHPALRRATRRGGFLNGGGGEVVAATAGHQDIQHVRRGQRAIGSRSACSGPQHRVCRCLSVQRRLVGRCCRRGGGRDGGCRT